MEEIKEKYEQFTEIQKELYTMICNEYDVVVNKMEKAKDIQTRTKLFNNFLTVAKLNPYFHLKNVNHLCEGLYELDKNEDCFLVDFEKLLINLLPMKDGFHKFCSLYVLIKN